MTILRKKVNELLSVRERDSDEVWITNRVLDGLSFEFEVLSETDREQSEKWTVAIAKNNSMVKPADKKYLCLEGEHSCCWINDGFTFLGNMTGIYLDETQAFLVSMLLPKLPDALKDIFNCKSASFSPVPADAYGLSIHYGTHDLQQSTVIWMDKTRWIELLSNQKFTPRSPAAIPSLLFQRNIILGHITLGYVECSQLEPGDLLFFEKNNFSLDGTGHISIGNLRFDVRVESNNNQSQLIINRWSKQMSTHNEYDSDQDELISDDMAVSVDDADQPRGQKALEVPVSDLPVKLTVKLGSIQFTVGDLGKLVEGKVYPIDSMCPGKVQLMANGMELARGQLVEVDGKLAVEVQRRWIQP